MQIRTDDDVYRVDAVWLGPPRATFPWRARYSSYGVGLLVMIFVMFVQRRLGIDLGFFSVAWALLITVVVTRFVGRRIDEDRPLLEWLTLFAHELRGPRRRTQGVGGPLSAGHVQVRRDRPRLTASPTAVALPRGSGTPDPDARIIPTRVRVRPAATGPVAGARSASARVDAASTRADARADARVDARPVGAGPVGAGPATPAPAETPGRGERVPVHGRVERAARTATDPSSGAAPPTSSPRVASRPAASARPSASRAASSRDASRSTAGRSSVGDPTTWFVRSSRPDREDADDGFGPPTATTIGGPVEPVVAQARADGSAGPAALPPAPPPSASAAATVASWRRARGHAEVSEDVARDRVRVPSARVERDRRAARAARPPRPDGGARRFGPSSMGRPDPGHGVGPGPDGDLAPDRATASGAVPAVDADVPSSFGPGTRRTRPDREGDGAAP